MSFQRPNTFTAGLLAALLATLGAAGCKETISSKNIATQGIAMLTEVTATSATRSRVEVRLLSGGDESNTYVDVVEGDELIAEAGDDSVTMDEVETGVYEAEFDIGAEDTEFRVLFMRTAYDDATDNDGTLPAPFSITSDFGDEALSRADDNLPLTWEPGSNDSMELEIDDAADGCIYPADFDLADDDGTYSVPAGQIDSTGGDDPETCDLTLTLTRSRAGSFENVLDPESRFRLHQVRSTSLTSSP